MCDFTAFCFWLPRKNCGIGQLRLLESFIFLTSERKVSKVAKRMHRLYSWDKLLQVPLREDNYWWENAELPIGIKKNYLQDFPIRFVILMNLAKTKTKIVLHWKPFIIDRIQRTALNQSHNAFWYFILTKDGFWKVIIIFERMGINYKDKAMNQVW